jgi:hypothetical protein
VLFPLLLPPHPTHEPAITMNKTASEVHSRQRRRGTPKKKSKAASAVPPIGINGLARRAALGAVVTIVSVIDAGPALEICCCVGFRLHVGASVALPVPV